MLPTWSPLRLSIAGLVLRGSMRAIPSGPEIPHDLIFKAGYMVATFCVVTLFCLAIPGWVHIWGEERIANELLLKLGIRVSPRTVNKYLRRLPRGRPRGRPRGDLRWSTFLRLHAHGIIACDFFVAVTATFRLLYVFVVIEHRSRRLIHCNVTAHPSAAWTLQQLREAVGFEERYEYLLHDRDGIFAKHIDESIGRLGVKVLKSPPRSPMANAICERVIGTIRRE